MDVTGIFPHHALASLLPGQSAAQAVALLIPRHPADGRGGMRRRASSCGSLALTQGDERQQLKWFAWTVTVVIAAVVISIVVIFGNGRYSLVLFSLIPIPIAVAVLEIPSIRS